MESVNESNMGFATPAERANDLPEGVHLELSEAPLGAGAPEGSVAINVPVNVIMDQIHMHWAQQMAGQIQRNAELAAALTVTQEALQETQAKLAALTEVTNAPAEDAPSRVRHIPDVID